MTGNHQDHMAAAFYEELTEIDKTATAGAVGRYALGAFRGASRAIGGGKGTVAERVMGRSAGQHGFLGGLKHIYQRGAGRAEAGARKAMSAKEGPTRELKGLGWKRFLGGSKAVLQSTPGRMAVVGSMPVAGGAAAHSMLRDNRR